MIFRRAILFASLLVLASSPVFSANAIMGRYDPQQTSYTAEKLEPPLILSWEFTGNKYDNNPAAPVVADGVCYFASGDRVYAIDMDTGNQKWKYPSDQGLGGTVKGTPTIIGDKLYFGTGDGKLYCLDSATGTFEWFYETRGAIRCPPVVLDGIMYFGADDNSLYTLNADTGETAWSKPFIARDDFGVGVAVGSGMAVVACMDGNLYGVNASSGKLRWIFRLPTAPVKTSPVMTESITIMAVGNVVYGLTTRSGQKRWMIQLPSEASASPAVDGSDIYVPCHDKKLYCYNVSGRQPAMKWTAPAEIGGIPMSSPTVADKLVYVTGSHGVAAAFSTVDGALKWRYTFLPSQVTTPGTQFCDASSSPTVSNGALVVVTDDGVLHCFTKTAPDNEPPEVYNLAPTNGVAMSGAPPIKMSATLFDYGSGVDFSSVTMYLDDQPVECTPDVSKATVTYETDMGSDPAKPVVKPLADGVHTITIEAKDYAGNQIKKSWFFIADSTLPPPRRTKVEKEVGKKQKEPTKPGGMYSPSNPPGNNGGMMPPPPPPPMPAPAGSGEQPDYPRGDHRRDHGRGMDQQTPPDAGGF